MTLTSHQICKRPLNSISVRYFLRTDSDWQQEWHDAQFISIYCNIFSEFRYKCLPHSNFILIIIIKEFERKAVIDLSTKRTQQKSHNKVIRRAQAVRYSEKFTRPVHNKNHNSSDYASNWSCLLYTCFHYKVHIFTSF